MRLKSAVFEVIVAVLIGLLAFQPALLSAAPSGPNNCNQGDGPIGDDTGAPSGDAIPAGEIIKVDRQSDIPKGYIMVPRAGADVSGYFVCKTCNGTSLSKMAYDGRAACTQCGTSQDVKKEDFKAAAMYLYDHDLYIDPAFIAVSPREQAAAESEKAICPFCKGRVFMSEIESHGGRCSNCAAAVKEEPVPRHEPRSQPEPPSTKSSVFNGRNLLILIGAGVVAGTVMVLSFNSSSVQSNGVITGTSWTKTVHVESWQNVRKGPEWISRIHEFPDGGIGRPGIRVLRETCTSAVRSQDPEYVCGKKRGPDIPDPGGKVNCDDPSVVKNRGNGYHNVKCPPLMVRGPDVDKMCPGKKHYEDQCSYETQEWRSSREIPSSGQNPRSEREIRSASVHLRPDERVAGESTTYTLNFTYQDNGRTESSVAHVSSASELLKHPKGQTFGVTIKKLFKTNVSVTPNLDTIP